MMFEKTVSWVPQIRSLRLRIQCFNNGNEPASSEALKQILGKLTGVRWIHIDLEQIFNGSCSHDKRVEEDSLLTKQLLRFGGRALKVAAVVISDARFCGYNVLDSTEIDACSLRRRRWTMTEKQEYAHFLQNALIEHRGKGFEGDMG